ncbi:unnamed protein product [Cuscuta europaea]|uniref:Uncharacterized protein n=1 Tax=Cuscuta europaea TaxID=41803 RepID=A0A9P0ZBD3_CUSEU|nr:unnamed protein product [Cuscuta europaea]
MAEEKKKTIKLFCPSIAKLVPVVALEDQRLDLGLIARTFGIEPATLKLNGHFVSRGIDLIASSVTWKSLISFFSTRGFSTGTSDSDALIVDGKLSKLGSKRGAHIPVEDEIQSVMGSITHQECTNRISIKRMKHDTPRSSDFVDRRVPQSLCLKRKLGLDRSSAPLKRTRMNESNTDLTETNPVFVTKGDRHLPCSLVSDEAKRRREEDMGVASPLKKIRN